MNEQKKDIFSNALSSAFWMKTLYVLGFYFLYKILQILVSILVVVQWLSCLIYSERNQRITEFSGSLSQYIFTILRYITYVSDQKPYPLSDWPKYKEDK
jgi:hypothetical protein